MAYSLTQTTFFVHLGCVNHEKQKTPHNKEVIMKKKFLSMITAIVMLMSLLPQGIITVSAAITATRPTVGDGTVNNPYQIGTAPVSFTGLHSR